MSKRRASVLGKRGAGTHQPEHVQNSRPAGEVRPIISKSKHGKMIRTFHDLDENPLPDFDGARRALGGIVWACIVVAIFSVAMCGATVAHGQNSPDIEFRSLFQIRYALPDTV